MLGITLVLCAVVVIAAVSAERSARSHRRFRAIGLNLIGLACLGLGLGALFAWSHGVKIQTTQIAVASAVAADTLADSAERDEALDDSSLPMLAEQESIPLVAEDEAAAEEANVDQAAEAEPADDEVTPDITGSEDLALVSKVLIDYDARPDWVDREDVEVGQVHQISVCSGPFMQLRESRKVLKGELKKAVDEYINDLVDHPQAAFWLGLDEQFISTNLVQQDNLFDEKIISPSFGVMHQSHALIEVGPQFRDYVETRWHEIHARGRLVALGLAFAGVLGVLLALFGYFNVDTATRGFYTGRLKFVTAAAILAIVVAGWMLARSIPWLWI